MIRKVVFTLGVLLSIGLSSYYMYADCTSEAFIDTCTGKLKGFAFLKAYKVNSKQAKGGKPIEYSYVFSKNTNYMLSVCNGEGGNMVVNLYDKNRRLLATSFDKRTNKNYPALIYRCTATGVYYISFEFSGGEGCGASVLGFKK